MDDEQVANHAVEFVAEHGPEMVTELVIEEIKRRMVLEQAMGTSARNGLDPTPVTG